jgi:hypothetical protein
MKLASRSQGGNRGETADGKGMCVCVCREVNFSEALYRIAVAMASQARIDVVVGLSYRMIIKYLSIPMLFSEIV